MFKACLLLETANISSNMLTDRTGHALIQGFETIRTLQRINLDYNFIGEKLRQDILRFRSNPLDP